MPMPSGVKDARRTDDEPAEIDSINTPVSRSHSLAVPSWDVVKTRAPSRENSSDATAPVWPARVATNESELMSHFLWVSQILATRSPLPAEARNRSSSEQARAVTRPWWA